MAEPVDPFRALSLVDAVGAAEGQPGAVMPGPAGAPGQPEDVVADAHWLALLSHQREPVVIFVVAVQEPQLDAEQCQCFFCGVQVVPAGFLAWPVPKVTQVHDDLLVFIPQG
jgi:hypothetical protein